MKKIAIIAVLTLAIVTFAGCSLQNVSQQPAAKKTIKVGFVAPLTGDAATYGQYGTKAFKMAVEKFNNEDHKIKFDVIYEDGKCDGKEAVSVANKLIGIDGVKYIIGGFCSGETLAMAPIAESNKVIMLSPGSGSPDITKAGKLGWSPKTPLEEGFERTIRSYE